MSSSSSRLSRKYPRSALVKCETRDGRAGGVGAFGVLGSPRREKRLLTLLSVLARCAARSTVLNVLSSERCGTGALMGIGATGGERFGGGTCRVVSTGVAVGGRSREMGEVGGCMPA